MDTPKAVKVNDFMSETIRIEFDPTDLPRWSQRVPEAVWLAERNLAFRVNLFRATTANYKRMLIKEAQTAQARSRQE